MANASNRRGRTPLHVAAELGHSQAVEALLGIGGLRLDMVDFDGNTALNLAARAPLCERPPPHVNFEKVAELLLCKGKDAPLMDVSNNVGQDALDFARASGNEGVVN